MSAATTHGLPRTRSLSTRRPVRVWWTALGLAVLGNLAMVILLAQVSRLPQALPEPPLAVRSIRTLPPEPPPEVPLAALQPVAVAQDLPALDLPSLPSLSTLALPVLTPLESAWDIPLTLPTFAAATGHAPFSEMDLGALDQPAERTGDFDLERFYPRGARARGLTGSSRIRLAIDALGAVSTVTILSSSPEGLFEQAAERLGHSLRFVPAQRGGQPVASTQDTTITWTLRP